MRTHALRIGALALGLALAASPAGAQEIKLHEYLMTQGKKFRRAEFVPWSGDWWNMANCDLAQGWVDGQKNFKYDKKKETFTFDDKIAPQDFSPLVKYDKYVEARWGQKSGAALYELQGDYKFDAQTGPNGWFHHVHGKVADYYDKEGIGYGWWGHCNGWAAASILAREPRTMITEKGVRFEVADLKGLLTESFFGVESDFTGRRYSKPSEAYQKGYADSQRLLDQIADPAATAPKINEYVAWYEKVFETKIDDATKKKLEKKHFKNVLERFREQYRDRYEEAYKDLRPDVFHKILMTVIGMDKSALVFDTSCNEEVWNFPAYAFETDAVEKATFTDKDGKPRRRYSVETRVWYATDGVSQSVLGLKSFTTDYRYDIITDENRKMVDGEWTGASVDQHPDFAWLPIRNPVGADAEENVKLEFGKLLTLLPAYWDTGLRKRLDLVAELPDGRRIRSEERRDHERITTLHNPVVLNGQKVTVSLARQGNVATWRARFYVQKVEDNWSGAFEASRLEPVFLAEHTRKAGDARTDAFRVDVVFPETGLQQVVVQMFNDQGRLVSIDELAFLVNPPVDDDALEENDTLSTARVLAAGLHEDLMLVDEDYYRFELKAGQGFLAALRYIEDDGQIALTLYDEAGKVITLAENADAITGIKGQSAKDAVYTLAVTSPKGSILPYDLELRLHDGRAPANQPDANANPNVRRPAPAIVTPVPGN